MRNFGRPRISVDDITYPIRGWEPPPPISGYERDSKNKFRFIKIIKPCIYRMRIISQKECGAVRLDYECKCNKCKYNNQNITTDICNNCEFRSNQHLQ